MDFPRRPVLSTGIRRLCANGVIPNTEVEEICQGPTGILDVSIPFVLDKLLEGAYRTKDFYLMS
jgi:hypothetical protein